MNITDSVDRGELTEEQGVEAAQADAQDIERNCYAGYEQERGLGRRCTYGILCRFPDVLPSPVEGEIWD